VLIALTEIIVANSTLKREPKVIATVSSNWCVRNGDSSKLAETWEHETC